jgi:galacturonosyltransferase
MKKNILILVNHENVIYNFRKELVFSLVKKGFSVIISSPNGSKLSFFNDKNITIENLIIKRHSINPIHDFILLINYIKLLKKYNPKLVLSYTIKPNIYGALACRFTKTKFFATVTGLGISLNKKPLLSIVTTFLYRIAFNNISHVFFQNSEDLNFMVSKKIVRNNYSLINGSGVNTLEFKYQKYPRSNIISFIFVGRIMKSKGIDVFLNLALKIKSLYKNTKFHIIGPMEENYHKSITNMVKKGIIVYHGNVSNVTKYYNLCHAIIHPSLSEGMSNVLLEAAASGRPILASNIAGCKEIFEENKTGISFNPIDDNSVFNSVIKFIDLPFEKKKLMGFLGRKKVQLEFDRSKVVYEYIRHINSVL